MKQIMNQILCLVAFLGISSIPVFGKPFAKGPYLGQVPPGPIPKVFAPGLICHNGAGPHQCEAFGTFSADGNTFCFARGRDVFITENTNQGWTTPKHIEITIDDYWSPWSPCLSPDANSIFCTVAERHPRIKRYDLYRCNRTSHGWTKPQRLGPPLSSPAKEITCSFAANNSIYLGSGRKGHGKGIIWAIPFEGNTWARAVHIDLNFPAGDAGIAPDESFMVFTAINLPGGYGHRDIYLTLHLPDGTWSKPRNLGPRINTAYIEHGPRISPDKKYLFFNRSNGWDYRIYSVHSDIYWVELKEYLPDPNGPMKN
jgi:hypothetical protein